MFPTANDTLLLNQPVVRRPVPPVSPADADRTKDLTRIIRRVLRNPGSDSPMSRAIRAALATVATPDTATDGEAEALRIRQVALRLDTLLAQRAAQPDRLAHRETVRF